MAPPHADLAPTPDAGGVGDTPIPTPPEDKEKLVQQRLAELNKLVDDYQSSSTNMSWIAISASIIAVALLVLWAVTTLHIIRVVRGDVDMDGTAIRSGLILVNTTIGGLVSALIVAVLSNSEPGGNPAERLPIFAHRSARQRHLAHDILTKHFRVKVLLEPYINGDDDQAFDEEVAEYLAIRGEVLSVIQSSMIPERVKKRYDPKLSIDRTTKDNNHNGDTGASRWAALLRMELSDNDLLWLYTRLIAIYVATWIIIGLAALWFGVIVDPKSKTDSETLQAIGTTWLGIAVAITYAYFGISPPTENGGGSNDSD